MSQAGNPKNKRVCQQCGKTFYPGSRVRLCHACGHTGPCRHCNRVGVYQGRKLCRACFDDPEVRQQYPSRYDNTEVPSPTGQLPTPTDCPAGSDQKIEVLAERVRKGEALWHSNDSRVIQLTPIHNSRRSAGNQWGAWLRAKRKEKGLSVVEVARRVGKSPATIGEYEIGKGGSPTGETFAKICACLGVAVPTAPPSPE